MTNKEKIEIKHLLQCLVINYKKIQTLRLKGVKMPLDSMLDSFIRMLPLAEQEIFISEFIKHKPFNYDATMSKNRYYKLKNNIYELATSFFY